MMNNKGFIMKILVVESIIFAVILFLSYSVSSENTELDMSKPLNKVIEEEKQTEYIIQSQTVREVTAYNTGDINQCSGDPCRSANGEDICLAISLGYKRCAANFVPFGTVLEVEGIGRCLVTDRMNSKYPDRVDIAFAYGDTRAREFGIKLLTVKILINK